MKTITLLSLIFSCIVHSAEIRSGFTIVNGSNTQRQVIIESQQGRYQIMIRPFKTVVVKSMTEVIEKVQVDFLASGKVMKDESFWMTYEIQSNGEIAVTYFADQQLIPINKLDSDKFDVVIIDKSTFFITTLSVLKSESKNE